jgi:hypothetical protein
LGLIGDEDERENETVSSQKVEVPQSLWMKKEEEKLAKIGTQEHRLSGGLGYKSQY